MIGRQMMKVLFVACSVVAVARAQYTERWRSPPGYVYYVGCENTDADNSKEVVLMCDSTNADAIWVVDGASGAVEWTLTPPWSVIYRGDLADALHPRLVDVNSDGRYEILFWGKPATVEGYRWYLYGYAGGAVGEGPPGGVVYREMHMTQNRPNPAALATTIDYALERRGEVVLTIFDAAGRLVRTLVEGARSPGAYSIVWDLRDDRGVRVPNSTYYYELAVDGRVLTKKMVVIR